jgi:hypothetical protein
VKIASTKSVTGMALICVLLLSRLANAGAIQYTVNQTIGAASVTGTITTDGTIGTLAAIDIIAWQLQLYDGSVASSLMNGANGGNVVVAGTALTATQTTLTYNYGLGFPNDFYIYDTGLGGEVCYTSYSNCWGPPGVGVYNVQRNGQSHYIAQSGLQLIASEGVPAPEPATFALLGFGLVALRLAKNHTRNKKISSSAKNSD